MPKTPTVDREETLARELSVPLSFVHNSIRKLKERGRVASAKRIAPRLTSRDLARILLGLGAPLPLNAPEVEQKLGALLRTSGDGATTAETEIVDLLDEASGGIGGNIDFQTGDILISADGTFLIVSGDRKDGGIFNRIYRQPADSRGMQRIARIQLQALRRIAQQLL